MRITEHDELLIQRCLDDELSGEETRALMYRLNQLNDGWKLLACGFLQERAIDKHLRSFDGPVTAGDHVGTSDGISHSEVGDRRNSEVVPVAADGRQPADRPFPEPPFTQKRTAGDDPVAESLRVVTGGSASGKFGDSEMTPVMPRQIGARRRQLHHWWSHPLTSLSLCAAIALVIGLLLPGPAFLWNGGGDQMAASGNRRTAVDSAASIDNSAAENTRLAQGRSPENSSAMPLNYRVQFQPSGSLTNEPMNIPVIRDREKFYEALRRNGQVTQQFLREFPWLETENVGSELKAVRVSLDEQHDVLIFMDDRSFGPPVQ